MLIEDRNQQNNWNNGGHRCHEQQSAPTANMIGDPWQGESEKEAAQSRCAQEKSSRRGRLMPHFGYVEGCENILHVEPTHETGSSQATQPDIARTQNDQIISQ